mgnify:FL=1
MTTNIQLLRPPRWVTPSNLPSVREGCPFSVQMEATQAQFYCAVPSDIQFPAPSLSDISSTTFAGQNGSPFNAGYTTTPRNLHSADDGLQVCFTNGSDYTLATGADGSVTEENVYEMFNGELCMECIVDKLPLPRNLNLNRFSGLLSGTITELDEWAMTGRPEDFEYTEENYHTVGSETLNNTLSYDFQVVAFNQAGFTARTFTLPIINNWSSDRDRFIKEVVHTNNGLPRPRSGFFVDGEFVDNETYFSKMREKGFFPPEGC